MSNTVAIAAPLPLAPLCTGHAEVAHVKEHFYGGSSGFRCELWSCRRYQCQQCLVAFGARHGALYCSRRCRLKAHRVKHRHGGVS